jgi:hypothetical protein
MNDPTADLIRAFEVRVGDFIACDNPWWFRVYEIEGIGGDEMGPAVWRFYDRNPDIGGTVEFPYAALVRVYRGTDD